MLNTLVAEETVIHNIVGRLSLPRLSRAFRGLETIRKDCGKLLNTIKRGELLTYVLNEKEDKYG